MATCPCKMYFRSGSQVGYGVNIIRFDVGLSYTFNASRPWIPVAICIKQTSSGVDSFLPDVTTSLLVPDIYKKIFSDCLTASIKNAEGLAAPTFPAYQSGDYGPYLAQQQCLEFNTPAFQITQDRFYQTAAIVNNFWKTLDPATTNGQLQKQLADLMEIIKKSSDNRMWLPPGSYYLPSAVNSKCYADLDAVTAATGDLSVFVYILELIASE